MARILYTTQDLVDQVRAQLDENNVDSVSTEKDILPSLNRAQDYAFDILARKYPEPILQYGTLELVADQAEYTIPESIFEDRVDKVEVMIPSSASGGASYREIQRVSYRDISNYESANRTNIPYYYAIYARKIRLIPTPTGVFNCRLWSLRNPEKLVLPQGRLTVINTTSNYVIVDSIGDSVTTEADQLGSYLNWIDGATGEIKATLQVQALSGNKITFRSTPMRTSVLNRTVTGTVTGVGALDDYLSPIDGTCVPYYGRPTSNFLIQFAVSEITRKLGGAADLEEKILEKFEKQVEHTWVGREHALRIKKRSNNWGVPTRRWYFE